MATLHHNITGEITKELLKAGDNIRVSSISLTNIGDTHPCTVDLYINKKSTGKFYILKNTPLLIGNNLTHRFSFNNAANQFGLYIKLTKAYEWQTPAVDVIIK